MIDDSATGGVSYREMDDASRLNFVYLYNIEHQEFKEIKEKILVYMDEYYY